MRFQVPYFFFLGVRRRRTYVRGACWRAHSAHKREYTSLDSNPSRHSIYHTAAPAQGVVYPRCMQCLELSYTWTALFMHQSMCLFCVDSTNYSILCVVQIALAHAHAPASSRLRTHFSFFRFIHSSESTCIHQIQWHRARLTSRVLFYE